MFSNLRPLFFISYKNKWKGFIVFQQDIKLWFKFFNSNIVKVLLDENRDTIGFRRDLFQEKIGGWYRHVGLYAYRKDTLLKFAGLPTSENEKKFHLEQLRALDNGIPIRAVITDYPYRGVDVEEDLNVIIKMNKHEKL